jgi:hypothetical protein
VEKEQYFGWPRAIVDGVKSSQVSVLGLAAGAVVDELGRDEAVAARVWGDEPLIGSTAVVAAGKQFVYAQQFVSIHTVRRV